MQYCRREINQYKISISLKSGEKLHISGRDLQEPKMRNFKRPPGFYPTLLTPIRRTLTALLRGMEMKAYFCYKEESKIIIKIIPTFFVKGIGK